MNEFSEYRNWKQFEINNFTLGRQKAMRFYLYFHKGIKRCAVCGEYMNFKDTSLEHIIPKSQGGGWGFDNISLSHKKCNNERADKPLGLLKHTIALKCYLLTDNPRRNF